VRVERRGGKESYGRGKNIKMEFQDFLTLMEAGDDTHYMTTQDLGTDEEGRVHLTRLEPALTLTLTITLTLTLTLTLTMNPVLALTLFVIGRQTPPDVIALHRTSRCG